MWSKEAEACLIQLVKNTDRDEDWTSIANTLNPGKFTYNAQDEYDVHGTHQLQVVPGHCRLYYDRQIQFKYPNDYVHPRGYDAPIPNGVLTIAQFSRKRTDV